MGRQGPHAVQREEEQSPAPVKEQAHPPEHAGAAQMESSFAEKDLGGRQADHEPVMFPCGKEGRTVSWAA